MKHLPEDPAEAAKKLRLQAVGTSDPQVADFLRMLADDYEELAKRESR